MACQFAGCTAAATAVPGKTYKEHLKFFQNLSASMSANCNPEHKQSVASVQVSIPHWGPRVALKKQKRRVKRWHVFLSHSKKFATTPYVVRMVKTHLKAKGYAVFFDIDNLTRISMMHLKDEIAQSHMFILFLDQDTLSSLWCQLEIAAAIEYGIPIHVVINIDHFNIPALIELWRGKQPNIAKKLFGADSYQAIPYSVSHEVLHDSALAKIEERIQMSLG